MNEDPERIDRLLELLESKERRKVVEYFRSNGSDTETVDVLGACLARLMVEADGSQEPSSEVTRTQLHHVHLPKMEEYGVVEYDSRSGHVRYHSDEQVEEIVQFLDEV